MAKNNVSELDVVAGNNADLAGISILGSGLLSTADDSFRTTASFLAKWWDDIGGVNTVGGTGDAITVTTPTLYGALKTGMRLSFIASAANTTATTLNLDAIGAKAVRKISGGADAALIAGDIPGAKVRVEVGYDATANSAAGAWIILGIAATTYLTPATAASTYLPLTGAPDILSLSPSADQNDYATGASTSAARDSQLKLTPSASIKITGISTTSWETGKKVTIRNATSITGADGRLIILGRNSASSLAANRFVFSKSPIDRAPIMLAPGDEAVFRYDGTNLKYVSSCPDIENWAAKWSVSRLPYREMGGTFWGGGSGTGAAGTVNQREVIGSEIWNYTDTQTGTTTTGTHVDGLMHGLGIQGGNGALVSLCGINIPTLSTVSDEFNVYVGFNDMLDNSSVAGVAVDAIGWQYKRLGSTNWQTYSRSNSTETLVANGPVVTAGAYIQLGTFLNGDGSRADFFYSTDNGETWTFVAAITTNLPTGTARVFGSLVGILKSAGTTNRDVHVAGTEFRWLQ